MIGQSGDISGAGCLGQRVTGDIIIIVYLNRIEVILHPYRLKDKSEQNSQQAEVMTRRFR